MKEIDRDKKIIVAMSGGIDSSVTAALLKERGFSIAGAFMRFWSRPTNDESEEGFNRCCSPEAEERARRIAGILKIPFYIIDLREDFKKEIVDLFLEEYRSGRTPNPCVDCNEKIKLGILLKKAGLMGFDFVATGHYVRKVESTGIFHLMRGIDREKDQSYFLWKLNQDQLRSLVFPLGNYTKPETVKIANKFNLPLDGVKESMEVCFIKDSVKDFLSEYLGENPGDIVNEKGETVGRHSGLWFYTIGQRKGIGLSGGPYFVIGKDRKKNILIVGRDGDALSGDRLEIKDVNWISGSEPSFPLEAKVQIRYGRKASLAKIKKRNSLIEVIFQKPQRAVTSGQSAVIYDKDRVLGGGVII